MVFVTGDIKFSIESNDHDGWLLCDGRSLLCSEYPCLSTLINKNFGSLSTNTFNLPNCSGRVLAMADPTNGLNIGDSIGEDEHVLTTEEIPSHKHTGVTEWSGVHNHGGITSAEGLHDHSGYTDIGTSHTHSINDESFTNLAVNNGSSQITATGIVGNSTTANDNGSINLTLQSNIDGEHQHAVTNDNYHNHFVNNDSEHVHQFKTARSITGSGHNNIQPTIYVGNVFIYSL